MWSFVMKKQNKQWLWLAIDRNTREIVAAHVGGRDQKGAKALWKNLPAVYRQCAVCYTDFWSAYEIVLPDLLHNSIFKVTQNCELRR